MFNNSASHLSSEHGRYSPFHKLFVFYASLLTDHARGSQLQPATQSEGQNLLNALAQFVTSIGCIQSTDVQETGINFA